MPFTITVIFQRANEACRRVRQAFCACDTLAAATAQMIDIAEELQTQRARVWGFSVAPTTGRDA